MFITLFYFLLKHQMLAFSIALISPWIWLFILTKKHNLPKLLAVLLFVATGILNTSATISWILVPVMNGCKKVILFGLPIRFAPILMNWVVTTYLAFQHDNKKVS